MPTGKVIIIKFAEQCVIKKTLYKNTSEVLQPSGSPHVTEGFNSTALFSSDVAVQQSQMSM